MSHHLHAQISLWSKKKPCHWQEVGTLDNFKELEPAEQEMLQPSGQVCCLYQSLLVILFSTWKFPTQVHSVAPDLLLSLCLFPPASFSLESPFSPFQGESFLKVHPNFLYFPLLFEPYFLFLFCPSSFLSLSGTQSFRQHLICWVLSGSCGPPPLW